MVSEIKLKSCEMQSQAASHDSSRSFCRPLIERLTHRPSQFGHQRKNGGQTARLPDDEWYDEHGIQRRGRWSAPHGQRIHDAAAEIYEFGKPGSPCGRFGPNGSQQLHYSQYSTLQRHGSIGHPLVPGKVKTAVSDRYHLTTLFVQIVNQ